MVESGKEQGFDIPSYQYSYVDLPYVVNNPEEYIIPGCLDACSELWDKNIETFMCSNLQDNHFYVLLMDLSEKNMEKFRDLMEVDSRYFYSNHRQWYGIKVPGTTVRDKQMLTQLASVFEMQDVLPYRYQSEEEFLASYKTIGGGFTVDPDTLDIVPKENPELSNVSFAQALEATGKENLYVPEEHRVYRDSLFLSWHQRYVDSSQKGTTSHR